VLLGGGLEMSSVFFFLGLFDVGCMLFVWASGYPGVLGWGCSGLFCQIALGSSDGLGDVWWLVWGVKGVVSFVVLSCIVYLVGARGLRKRRSVWDILA
jgi:hypothetical protein